MSLTADRHLGVRGRAMLFCAVLWSFVGLGAIVNSSPPRPSTFHATFPRLEACLWFAAAVLAVFTSWRRDGSRIGLAALVVPPALRSASYVWAWVMDLVPGPPPGFALGWYTAILYLCMIALVVVVAWIPGRVEAPLTGPPDLTRDKELTG